jgi:predicted DNA-binding transcriptional regulator YafY
MSRSERLLSLLQVLRRYRRPVSGQLLAETMGISIRTLYRDIASLQAQGACIEGESGVGYVMKPGFMLPPLMFSARELDALILGMRLVADRGDRELAHGAQTTLAKISAVLPPALRRELENSTLFIGARNSLPDQPTEMETLRLAVKEQRKLKIEYFNASEEVSHRVVWPYAFVYFDMVRVLMCWCELRGTFRNFRTDRIRAAEILMEHYPRSKQMLLKEWRQTEYVPGRSILPETDSIER